MSTDSRASLEQRLKENPIIFRSRESGLLKSVIAKEHDPEFRHVVAKYSKGDAQVALEQLENLQVDERYGIADITDLTALFCEVVGCQDNPVELADYISDLNSWTSLWFLNAFGEVAREVTRLNPFEFYRTLNPKTTFSDRKYKQAAVYGKAFGAKKLFGQIKKSGRNMTSISEFDIGEVGEGEQEIRERLAFPERLSGGLLRIVRTRHPEILAKSAEVYREHLALANEFDALRTEGVLLYGASALGDFGHVIKDSSESRPDKAIFYAAFPSSWEKIMLWNKRPIDLVTRVYEQIKFRFAGYSLYKSTLMELEIEKDKVARKAREVTKLLADREIQAAELDTANARAEAAEASARAELAEERSEILETQRQRERQFNRKVLDYMNRLVKSKKGSRRHGIYNRIGVISGSTSKLAEHPLDTFYTQLENAASSSGIEGLVGEFRSNLSQRPTDRRNPHPFLSTNNRREFIAYVDQMCNLFPARIMGDTEGDWNARWDLLVKGKPFGPSPGSGEKDTRELLPIAEYKVRAIEGWYQGIREQFPTLEEHLGHDLLLSSIKDKITINASLTQIVMELEQESKESKDIGFGYVNLKELADDSVVAACADKGKQVRYNSSYGSLSQDESKVEGISSIIGDVLRDAMYNCIDAGSDTIDVSLGRLSEIKSEIDENRTLNLEQKVLLQKEGIFYLRIRDAAGKGKLSLVGPEGKPHKGALPMTQYLMTGTVPEEFLPKDERVNFTTKEGGRGGDGTSMLYEMLDFMSAKGFYDLTEQGTDLYLIFTKRELMG